MSNHTQYWILVTSCAMETNIRTPTRIVSHITIATATITPIETININIITSMIMICTSQCQLLTVSRPRQPRVAATFILPLVVVEDVAKLRTDSRRTLWSGLFPTRLNHTLNFIPNKRWPKLKLNISWIFSPHHHRHHHHVYQRHHDNSKVNSNDHRSYVLTPACLCGCALLSTNSHTDPLPRYCSLINSIISSTPPLLFLPVIFRALRTPCACVEAVLASVPILLLLTKSTHNTPLKHSKTLPIHMHKSDARIIFLESGLCFTDAINK